MHPHAADGAADKDLERIEKLFFPIRRSWRWGNADWIMTECIRRRKPALLFQKLIALGEKLKKPLFLHERDAEEDFISCFAGHEDICRRSVVHCYTGNKETAETLLDMGFSIGITGWICDERRAEALREAVKIIPLDRILLETDAPYLTPRGIPGLKRTNVPQNIVYVARALAHYMGISEENVIRHAKINTERIFGL
ncbi:MAG: TatD family hydrolase [Dialister invisus]